MTSHWETILECLKRQGSAAAKRLREETPGPFSEEDVAEIETLVLNHAPPKVRLDKLLDVVHAKVLELDPNAASFLRRKVAYAYPKYANDLSKGFHDSTAVYKSGVEWLAQRRKASGPRPARAHLAEFVVACVLDLQILHAHTVLPLIESIHAKRILRRGRDMLGVLVALPLRGGQERRVQFVALRLSTAKILKRIGNDPAVRAYLGQMFATEASDPSTFVAAIDGELAAGRTAERVLTLQKLIDAASQIAITRLPSCIRARRMGVVVSHALDIQALERIGGFERIPKFPPLKSPSPRTKVAEEEKEEELEEQHEIKDSQDTRVEPPWRTELRQAVKKTGINTTRLQALAKGQDANGMLIGAYTLGLSGKGLRPSTIYRYVLLTADRLIPRLKGRSPATLEEEEWEDLIEQLLDEDAYYHRRRYSPGDNRDQAGYSQPLLKAVRSFALFLHHGKKGASPVAKILPAAGGMKVNANFVTVDEFKEALNRIHRLRADKSKEHLHRAARVALILAFRLGLRKAEVAYLRASDFDAPVGGQERVPANPHLHVRSWLLRKLKTSNAERDLPLKVLVPPDELEEVWALVEKARSAGGARTRLFYSRRDVKKGMKFDNVITELEGAFRGRDGDRFRVSRFHFHLARHAAANVWLLKLWPELHPVARRILCSHRDKGSDHEKTLEWIADPSFRRALFLSTQIRASDLQAIAHLMGHGSASVTVEHYLHILDWFCPQRG